jgi:hypothetical protein
MVVCEDVVYGCTESLYFDLNNGHRSDHRGVRAASRPIAALAGGSTLIVSSALQRSLYAMATVAKMTVYITIALYNGCISLRKESRPSYLYVCSG